MIAKGWVVRLSATAEADFRDILDWTSRRFGQDQTLIYAETLSDALAELTAGPSIAGVRARDEIGRGILTLHVARNGNRGRHFILFRRGPDRSKPTIDVLRILHDTMDLRRHLPPDEGR